MNKNINLIKILKNCPKGWKFWSPLFGEVKFSSMDSDYVNVEIHNKEIWTFNTNATITFSNRESLELMLFPSREQKDWSKFIAPWYKRDRFDPKTFKQFDRVIIKNIIANEWKCDLFSHITKSGDYDFYRCLSGGAYRHCIPYNNDTKYLVGTNKEAPEYYRYWDD